jgi:GT2 family glycosyltransferase
MSSERFEASPLHPGGHVEQGQGQPPPAKEPAPLVSVLVPCCGQLEYTRLCVPSLLRYSRRPYEVIFLDIVSLDGTPEYLAGVAAAAPMRIDVVHAVTESAFRTTVAEGLARARGEFIVWLNNDTIVTDGWLTQLVALCSSHDLIGMAGPMANFAPSPQRVGSVPYRIGARTKVLPAGADQSDQDLKDLETVTHFAREWREQYKGQWFEAEQLGGFCLLIKRAALQKVSFFDEHAEKGLFDAGALCLRMRQAGYHLACCRDLYIHHFGSHIRST